MDPHLILTLEIRSSSLKYDNLLLMFSAMLTSFVWKSNKYNLQEAVNSIIRQKVYTYVKLFTKF